MSGKGFFLKTWRVLRWRAWCKQCVISLVRKFGMVPQSRIIGVEIGISLRIIDMVRRSSSQYLAISGYMSLDLTNFAV